MLYFIPLTVLALRGSGGLSLEAEWSECGLCAALSLVSFCCYLQNLVALTPPKCKRNTRSRSEMSNKLKTFHYFWAPAVPLGRWRYRGEGESINEENMSVFRMGLPIMESLSGLQESIFSLFRGLQLNSRKKSKKLSNFIKFIDLPPFPMEKP